MKRRITVIIESPYAGDRMLNIDYARQCMKDSLGRDEAPFLSHILYTQVLDDDKIHERNLGIQAGLDFGRLCDKTIVYTDLGISSGMQQGIQDAQKHGRPVEYRTVEGFSASVPETIACQIWSIEDPQQLYKKTRKREVVEARMVLMVHRFKQGESQERASRHYGLKHASVVHAGKTIADLTKTDRVFRSRIQEFEKIVQTTKKQKSDVKFL